MVFPGPATAPGAVTLLVAGEVGPIREPDPAAGDGDPHFPFGRIAPLIREADIAVAHLLETTWAGAGPEGPMDRAIAALSGAGFDVIALPGPLPDTLRRLEVTALLPLGAGADLAGAGPPQVVTRSGLRIGLVAFRDDRPSSGGFLQTAPPAGSETAARGAETLGGAVRSARAAADVVVVLVRWGPGASPVPDGRQRELARLAIEAGADLVLGVGPQAGQAVEWIRDRPVVYSLGRLVPAPGLEGGHPGVLARVRVRGREVDRLELVPVALSPGGQPELPPEPAGARHWLELEDRWARLWDGLPAAVQNRLIWAERLQEPATCPAGMYRVSEVRPDGIRLERLGYAASQFWITAPGDPAGCARVPTALLAELRERLVPGSPVAVTRRPSLSR
ncbi:MAG: CapA family protein [Firmicutes bacterium]|nr:CapA family protein [Bacillota bacterium]